MQHNKDEQNNLLNYGYFYIGNSFIPHITLGRDQLNNDYAIDDKIKSVCYNLFFDKPIKYSKIAFYKAGVDGANDCKLIITLDKDRVIDYLISQGLNASTPKKIKDGKYKVRVSLDK